MLCLRGGGGGSGGSSGGGGGGRNFVKFVFEIGVDHKSDKNGKPLNDLLMAAFLFY